MKNNIESCIFCRIINKEIPSGIVYENGEILAIEDIRPQAPVHVLIMPKKHIRDILSVDPDDCLTISSLFKAVGKVAEIKDIKAEGFRVIINSGRNAGQSVDHLHLHVLGGRQLGEKIV